MKRFYCNAEKLLLILLPFFFIWPSTSNSQTKNKDQISQKDYLNFWLGNWDLTWKNPDGSIGKGTNRVTKILKDNVIQESFKAFTGPQAGFAGISVSVYSPGNNLWHQTWVDNNGGYLDFVGKMSKDQRIFFRYYVDSQNKEIIQRMVFYNIKEKSFDWNWEISGNEGRTWEIKWQIHYSRK